MPRRTRPVERMATAALDVNEATMLRADVLKIIGREPWLVQLSDDERETLIGALVDSAGFARAGLADILSGKRTRPAAWTMDILVKDVCDALVAAGIPASMAFRCRRSLAQRLADGLAAVLQIPDQGELFKQMQRARRIEKAGGATCPKRPVLVLGRWQIET